MPDSLTDSLTADELRQLLEARAHDISGHVRALKHELSTVADITVAGRPLLDHVRQHPLQYVGGSLVGGLVMGLLSGLRARAKQRPEMDERTEVLRMYTAHLLDEVAARVAKGEETEKAVARTAKRRPPLIVYEPPGPVPRSTLSETLDIAVKTALGFGVKLALDRMAERLTGETEVVDAIAHADAGPGE